MHSGVISAAEGRTAGGLRLLLASLGASLAACGGGTTTSPSTPAPTPSPSPTSAAVPVLSVPIVDLDLLSDFLPFGFSASGRLNPTYELRTRDGGALVRAAGPGTVVNVLANPEGDSEIHVRPPDAPEYLVIYDHVVSLQVGTGQTVTAGQTLGRVGPFTPGVGRTELQVNRTTSEGTLALCPRQFGTAEFNSAHDAAFARFPGRGTSVCLASSVQP